MGVIWSTAGGAACVWNYTSGACGPSPCVARDYSNRAYTNGAMEWAAAGRGRPLDRKSTRLNSSHLGNSYAAFCLKKKKKKKKIRLTHTRIVCDINVDSHSTVD